MPSASIWCSDWTAPLIGAISRKKPAFLKSAVTSGRCEADTPVVHHTVRGKYGTPEAGTRTYSSTHSTQKTGKRSPYVQCGGPGTYVST